MVYGAWLASSHGLVRLLTTAALGTLRLLARRVQALRTLLAGVELGVVVRACENRRFVAGADLRRPLPLPSPADRSYVLSPQR